MIIHAARKEAAAAVALAIVQAATRLISLDQFDALQPATVELEEVEAVVQGQHRAAVPPQRQRPHVLRERPRLGSAGPGIQAPDAGVADAPSGAIHPVEAALLDVPDRPLAQMITAFEHTLDPVRHADATPSPRGRQPSEMMA